ncbi:MAG: DUF2155 domain-containing protein [Dissulfurispiraceae bacterium]
MTKKILLLLTTLGLVFFAACQNKEEQPAPKAPMQSPMAQPSNLSQPMTSPQPMTPQEAMPPNGQTGAPHGEMVSKAPLTIEVPADVKKSWHKVTLVFLDKGSKKTKEYTVNINSQFEIQGTDLKVAVGQFLPDFKMGATITSGSNEPVNPAVRVEVFEKGRSIFKGWLFSKVPGIHPFDHDKYGLILKEGIRS